MPDQKQKTFNDTLMLNRALNRWENEGGATTSAHKHPRIKILKPDAFSREFYALSIQAEDC